MSRRTIFAVSTTAGILSWWSCAVAVAQGAVPTTTIPSLDNLIVTTPLAGITLFLVKWLLSHLDAQRVDQQKMVSEFHAILERKDATFATFVETTYTRMDEYSRRLSDLAKNLLELPHGGGK